MVQWRRRASELFPQLRQQLNTPAYSVYSVFGDLKPMLRNAHDAENTELLRRIYAFAEWCSQQPDNDLSNAAGVAFYEHLFDIPGYDEQIVPWLSPQVVYAHWQLWKAVLFQSEWTRVRPLLTVKREEGERAARRSRPR